MQDRILEAFLKRQHEEGMALARASDLLELEPLDKPAQHYIARFHARGLMQNDRGEVIETDRFDVGISMPDDYLRRVDGYQILTYLGPALRPWHPNIMGPFICVHLTPGMALVDLLHTLYDLWRWSLYYTGDEGLNHDASQWARRQQPGRFPIDRRPLKRRPIDLDVEPFEEEHHEA